MKYAPIVPPFNLDGIRYGGYHMALAHKLASSPAYFNFYKERMQWGQFVIVDNGVAEVHSGDVDEPMPFPEVVRLANLLGADEVVMPDDINSGTRTLELYAEFAASVEPKRQMVVPHGDTLDEWQECARKLSRTAAATLGVSRGLDRIGSSRVEGLKWLVTLGVVRVMHIHLLGIQAHPRREIDACLAAYPGIRGVDSGVAAAYAQRGWFLKSVVESPVRLRPDEPVDPVLLRHNLNLMGAWCRGESSEG